MLHKTILIVDDIQSNIDILYELLQKKYDIVVALNGEEALSLLNREKINLILLDIMMPIMDGFEVCEKIKKNIKLKDIPIIFITAKNDEENINHAYEVGGVDYITKPFLPKELLARVETQFKTQHLIQSIESNVRFLTMNDTLKTISHEWRQPLQIIVMQANNILADIELDTLKTTELHGEMKNIISNAQKLSETLNSFHQFLNSSLSFKFISLYESMQKALEFNESILRKEKIEVEVKIDKNIEVNVDEQELHKVLTSLLKNAVEALINETKKTIFIHSSFKQENIILEIFNNGEKISEDVMPHIFEPYFSTKSKQHSVGLGLYMSKIIIEKVLNGILEVENKDNGVVTRIIFNGEKNE